MLTCLAQNFNACLCRAEDDAEMQDEAAGAAADGTDGGALFSGAGTAPASEAVAIDVGAPSAPGASTKSVDLTYTAADEERRQRLRQVSSLHQFSEGGGKIWNAVQSPAWTGVWSSVPLLHATRCGRH